MPHILIMKNKTKKDKREKAYLERFANTINQEDDDDYDEDEDDQDNY